MTMTGEEASAKKREAFRNDSRDYYCFAILIILSGSVYYYYYVFLKNIFFTLMLLCKRPVL